MQILISMVTALWVNVHSFGGMFKMSLLVIALILFLFFLRTFLQSEFCIAE